MTIGIRRGFLLECARQERSPEPIRWPLDLDTTPLQESKRTLHPDDPAASPNLEKKLDGSVLGALDPTAQHEIDAVAFVVRSVDLKLEALAEAGEEVRDRVIQKRGEDL